MPVGEDRRATRRTGDDVRGGQEVAVGREHDRAAGALTAACGDAQRRDRRDDAVGDRHDDLRVGVERLRSTAQRTPDDQKVRARPSYQARSADPHLLDVRERLAELGQPVRLVPFHQLHAPGERLAPAPRDPGVDQRRRARRVLRAAASS